MKQQDKEDLEKAKTTVNYYKNRATGLTGIQEIFEYLQSIEQINIITVNDLIDRVVELEKELVRLEKKLYPPF